MSKLLIFEDSDSTPSSLLLKSSFNGKNIYFSNGCGKIASLYNGIDDLCVFYDVSPNNPKTTQGYNDLKQIIVTNSWHKVVLLPIVCVEYIMIVMFDKYNYIGKQSNDNEEILNFVIRNFDWDKLSLNIKNNSFGTEESLEHICKRFISNQRMQCLHNSFKYDEAANHRMPSILGIFYEKDCDCERKYCYIDSTTSLREKAERLYVQLPLCPIISEEHRNLIKDYGIKVVEEEIGVIRQKQQDYCNYICRKMHRATIQV